MSSLQDIGLSVKRLQWRHHREVNRAILDQAGVSLVQWDVLRYLHHHPDASLRATAEATFQTDQSMGELAKRMIARGLIERIEGPGRAARHRLTSDGLLALEAGSGIADRVLLGTVGKLNSKDRATLLDLLEKSLAD